MVDPEFEGGRKGGGGVEMLKWEIKKKKTITKFEELKKYVEWVNW